MKKKILIVGKNSFIGLNIFKILKKKLDIISLDLEEAKNRNSNFFNKFHFIINNIKQNMILIYYSLIKLNFCPVNIFLFHPARFILLNLISPRKKKIILLPNMERIKILPR